MRKLALTALILLCLTPFLSLAQDNEPSLLKKCTDSNIQKVYDDIDDLKGDLSDAVTKGNAEKVASLTIELEGLAKSIRELCVPPAKNISFNSDDTGIDAGFGPVEIGEGMYRVTAETKGAFSVNFLPLEGECQTPTYSSGLFYLYDGTAEDGAEQLFSSEGCTIALQIDGNDDWTLDFELLEAEPEEIELPFEITNDDSHQQAVLGPFAFPSGAYKFTVTSDDSVTVNYVPVDGECNGGDYATSAISVYGDRASDGANNLFISDDCEAYLEVKNAPEDWTLNIETLADPIAFEDGMTFTSEEAGLYGVLGPIELPEGEYTVTATTDEYLIAEFELLDGDCVGENEYIRTLFNLSTGEGSDGATAPLTSEGCTLVITTSNSSEPWEIKISEDN